MTKLPSTKTGCPVELWAAPAQTYIVEINEKAPDGVLKQPVLGWAPDADNPYSQPHPMTYGGISRMLAGSAILHPCGMVSDPRVVVAFEDLDQWKAYCAVQKEPAKANPAHQKPASASHESEQEEPAQTMAEDLGVTITNKTLKQNSFWRFTDADYDFIMKVPSETLIPKASDTMVKIKGDEFTAAKKEGTEIIEYDAFVEAEEPETSEAPEVDEEAEDLL